MLTAPDVLEVEQKQTLSDEMIDEFRTAMRGEVLTPESDQYDQGGNKNMVSFRFQDLVYAAII